MSFKIRRVKKTDNSKLANIIRNIFEEYDAPRTGTVYSDPTTNHLYELFKTKGSELWVVEQNNEPFGCCGFFPSEGLPEKVAELVKFYISPAIRGKGFGKLLLNKCINSAIEKRYTYLYIESLPEFNKAINIYEKNGFKFLDTPLGNSVHKSCNIWMLKKL